MESSGQYCENCNKLYNLGSREPLVMYCCGSSICKACIDDLIRPQEEFFTCPYDDCKQQSKCDFKLPPNKSLKKMLDKQQTVNIYCSDHKNIKADFFCKSHQTMVCINCAIQNHVDHNKQRVPLITQEFDTFCSLVQSKLKIEKQRISSMIENFSLFLDKDHIFTSEEFIKLVKDSKDVISKHDFNQEEQKILGLLGDKFFEELKVDSQSNIVVNTPKIDSQIIKSEDLPLITGWLNNPQKVTFQLIFRGSSHGFTGDAFHKQCDNQGPTITFVRSENGMIFGGFCQLSWGQGDLYKADDKAFIFSITHKTTHEQYQRKDQAVHHGISYLIVFGGGNDIYIGDNCDINGYGYCNLGHTYKPQNGVNYQSEQAKSYLAGAKTFTVSEIETFKVIYN